MEKIIAQVTKALEGCCGWLFLLNNSQDSLRCEASLPSRSEQKNIELPCGEGLFGELIREGRPRVLNDYQSWSEGEIDFFKAMHSIVAAPVFRDDHIAGVLLIGRDKKQGKFTEEASQILELFSGQVTMALDNQVLVNHLSRRASQLSQINQLYKVLLDVEDLFTLAKTVAIQMARVFPVDGFLLIMNDINQQKMPALMIYASQQEGAKEVTQDESYQLLANEIFQGRIPFGILESHNNASLDPMIVDLFSSRSALTLPVMSGRETIGTGVVFFENREALNDWEIAFGEQVAHYIGFTMERIRTIEREQSRRKLFDAIREASIRLTSSLELELVLDAILSQTLELIHADDAHIFLYEEGQLSFAAARWADDRQIEPYSKPREGGITYTTARTGERIVTTDVNKDPFFTDWQWGGAIISLPLRMGGQVVGVMNVAFDRPHLFDDDELRVLDLLAVQAAIALQNARLFERIDGDRRRVRLLYELTNALVTELNDTDVLQRAIDLTTASLNASFGEAFLLEPKRNNLRLKAVSGIEQEPLTTAETNLAVNAGRGLEGWVIDHRKPAIVKDLEQDQRCFGVERVVEEVQSALSAPILAGNDLFGVLTVYSKKPFKEDQMDILEAIGRQVGLAISNARRYRQIERRFAEMSALQQVAKVINSRLEMQPLLDEIINQVHQVLGYPIVEIYLVEGKNLILHAFHGADEYQQDCIPLEKGIIGRVARENRTVFLPDVTLDPDYLAGIPDTQVEIAVPLRKGNIVIGVLNVESSDPEGLDDEDFRLLQLLADQVAVAIENASLYDHLWSQAQGLEKTVAERTAALAEALDQARVAERLKTQFVADVSHELRTPLANIRLYLELLSFGNPDRFPEYIETLLRETDRLVILIEDLLGISRLDVGTAVPKLEAQDLNQLTQSLIEDRTRLLKEKSLRVNLELMDGLPQVMADEHMITQVIANLVTNAMNYTGAGGCITIRTRRQKEDDREWVILTVADTGIGIPPEEQDRIFERFYRGSASRMMPVPGTGLGLAICKEILDRHAGRLTVQSQVAQGSEFSIWLPVSHAIEHSGS